MNLVHFGGSRGEGFLFESTRHPAMLRSSAGQAWRGGAVAPLFVGFVGIYKWLLYFAGVEIRVWRSNPIMEAWVSSILSMRYWQASGVVTGIFSISLSAL